MTPEIACVFGTYNRRAALMACVASIRAAAAPRTYTCLVADGGSTDGSREWLRDQPDCELLEGGLEGAVKAFNVGFARAVALGSPYVAQLNDDLRFPDAGTLARAADLIDADLGVGAVALASDRYTPGTFTFENMRYRNLNYCNQGLFRREAGMAAARAQGDPAGAAWWDRRFHTYASDTVLGLWLWRLGWRVVEDPALRVSDSFSVDGGHADPLRARNVAQYTNAELFVREWGAPDAAAYDRAAAERYGGRIL